VLVKKRIRLFMEKFAAYLSHCTHPSNDANKGTSYAVTLVFLEINNTKQVFQKEEVENLVIEVAKGNETKVRIAKSLQDGALG